MKNHYEVSKRQARKQLVHKERLRKSMAETYDAALRWYNATQALNTPGLGDGLAAFGEIAENVLTVAEGQKNLVRWHDGTLTMTWFPATLCPVGTWVVATTRWNEDNAGPWVGERLMHVEQLVDTMPADVKTQCDDYWRYSRELDELELTNLLMIAPVGVKTDPARGPESAESGADEIAHEL